MEAVTVDLVTGPLDYLGLVLNAIAAIVPTIIACLALKIASAQARTDEQRLRHELFDRRFEIMRAVQDFFIEVLHGRAQDPTSTAILDFEIRTASAPYVLDATFRDYIKDIRTKAIDLQYLTLAYDRSLPPDALEENVRKSRERHDWFSAEIRTLDEKFSPYLTLTGR